MAENEYMMPPLEVYAVDSSLNRLTGSIPYTSLTWHRRYYSCGEFSMTVPASIYSPEWFMIDTDMRPETGIVQKVEYTDDPTYGNDDTVTVSGFFLESIMNRRTFLDETPEEVTYRYYVDPPSPPKEMLKKPTIYTDSTGKYWYETPAGTTYGVADGTPADSPDRQVGSAVQTDADGQTYIETGSGRVNVTQETYGTQINSYYYTDGSTTSVNRVQNFGTHNETTTNQLAFDDGFGNVYYHDADTGTLKRATGVTEKQSDNYVIQKRQWDSTTDNGWVTVTKTVKGPWQITSVEDMTTEQDNIARCVGWAQMYFQNEMLFVDPDITGESKITDPSFTLLGDLLYQELQTVGASFRVEFDFLHAQFIFSVWQGLDRTQDQPDVPVEPTDPTWYTTGKVQSTQIETNQGSPVGKTIIYGASKPGPSRLPDGYTELEYIESTGTQYIETDEEVRSTSGFEVDFQLTGDQEYIGIVGGFNYGGYNNNFVAFPSNWASQYGDNQFFNFGSRDKERHVASQNVEQGITVFDGQNVANGLNYYSNEGRTFNAFCINGGDSYPIFWIGSMRIYSLSFYDGGTKTSEYIPCRNSSNEIGMYESFSGKFFKNSGTGSFISGPEIDTPDITMSNVGIVLNNEQWNIDLGGNTLGEGQTLTIQRDGTADIDGTSIPTQRMPLMPSTNVSIITDSSLPHYFDIEYQGYQDPVGGKNPWAVFSDTWGSLYGYDAQTDTSNYRNKCYVLYEYDAPTAWEGEKPDAQPVYEWNDTGTSRTLVGYQIPYETLRGFLTVRIDDGLDDRETYLDLRNDPPACDSEWSREMYSVDQGAPSLPDIKSQYDNFPASLQSQGMTLLQNEYSVIRSLETGDLRVNRYLKDYDMGDKVDMAVSTIGLVETARITGVEEVYESGSSTINLEIGEQSLDVIKKARMV